MVCQLRRLEQENRLGRKMEEGKQESVCVCKGGGFRSQRVNFGVFVICTTKAPPWLSMGLWHKMEKQLVDIVNGGPDTSDELSVAKMLHEEDKSVFALREQEFGRHESF